MMPDSSGPVAVIFGTRPEAIKLAPVIMAMSARGVPPLVVITGQHRELVDDVLARFAIRVDEDLNLMKPDQSLDYVLLETLRGVGHVLDRHRPRAVIVQGDTTSTLGATLAAFHRHVPVAHVEAGLRSHDIRLPFPEEANRRVVSMVARWHFAPTERAAENLRAEGIHEGVHVTGNTVVDALRHFTSEPLPVPARLDRFVAAGPFILATGHRRESWGEPIGGVARALANVLDECPHLRLVFATHPNPKAHGPVKDALGGNPRARIVDAMSYPAFIGLLSRAMLVVTDSGGVQEEGPTLGIPVVVTRTLTERPEGVAAGAVELVGTDASAVQEIVQRLVEDEDRRTRMADAGRAVYGDGHAARRIADVLVAEVPI